ncbi:unnamed protein product [Sphagnum balticum]
MQYKLHPTPASLKPAPPSPNSEINSKAQISIKPSTPPLYSPTPYHNSSRTVGTKQQQIIQGAGAHKLREGPSEGSEAGSKDNEIDG